MFQRRRPPNAAPAADQVWQLTEPGELYEPTVREQPPLKEVLNGLELRELEGETVFDQLFGPSSGG